MHLVTAASFERMGLPHGFTVCDAAGDPHGNFGWAQGPREAVQAARDAVAGQLGVQHIVTARQVHGTRAIVVAGATDEAADALLTQAPDLAVGVLTADCVPVLLASACGRWVAAVHAGWRGAVAGVIEAAVAALRAKSGASVLRAVVGPHIEVEAFEVSDAVAARFDGRCARAGLPRVTRRGRPGHAHVDLRSFSTAVLQKHGVESVEHVAGCTVSMQARFHSYRRDGAQAGRQLAVVAPCRR